MSNLTNKEKLQIVEEILKTQPMESIAKLCLLETANFLVQNNQESATISMGADIKGRRYTITMAISHKLVNYANTNIQQ